MSKHRDGERLTRAGVSRRRFLQGAGAAAAVGASGIAGPLARAGAAPARRRAGGAGEIKIGYVTPRTGPLAPFGEADRFTLNRMRKILKKGIPSGGDRYDVRILARDSQSDPDRAADVATELILEDEINLMLVSSTPETTNPVSDICEANEQPCISTMTPWQPYFVGRGGDPADPDSGFDWTYHFFWGLEDISAVFLDMWGQISTNQQVAGLFPNDGDGEAWSDPQLPFSAPITSAGYTITDPGLYPNGNDNFSSQIGDYKAAGDEILTGVPLPPDFTTFWTQALQQDFRPTIATVGKALLFPSSVNALGDDGENLSSELWWGPTHPFVSSLTEQTCQELADQFERRTDQQWTQPIGFGHAVFEVGVNVLERSGDPTDKEAIVEAIPETDLDTIAGHVQWGEEGLPKNVAKTPLVGGQWVRSDGPYDYDLIVVSNAGQEEIPKAADLQPLPGA